MSATDSDEESWQGLTCLRKFTFNGISVNVQEHWGSSIGKASRLSRTDAVSCHYAGRYQSPHSPEGGSIWEGGVLLAEYLR